MDYADKLDMMDDDCDIQGFPNEKETMPNKMNHADLADRLEKECSYQSAAYHTMGADGLDNGWFGTLCSTAADERRIANGKLVPAPVKCGECKYFQLHPNDDFCDNAGICKKHSKHCDFDKCEMCVFDTDFCSYGERKGGGEK